MCFNLPFSVRHGSAGFLLLSIKQLWRAGAAGSWLGEAGNCSALHGPVMGTGKAESGMEKEMRLEQKRLLLIICIGNIVWFSSVHSQSVSLQCAGEFCEKLLLVYKLAERHGCF